jgi:hypothetical protein
MCTQSNNSGAFARFGLIIWKTLRFMEKSISSIKCVFQFYPHVCLKHFSAQLNMLRDSIELSAETPVYLHVKCPLLLSGIIKKSNSSTYLSETL